MSRRRAWRPSIRYSLSPERKSRRVMVTSPCLLAAAFWISWTFGAVASTPFSEGPSGAVGVLSGPSPPSAASATSVTSTGCSVFGWFAGSMRGSCFASGLTRTIVTEAMPSGLRALVPAKITSSIRAPRRDLADCSPRTQLIASLRFDLPHPFGPTTAAMPPPLNFSSVRSQKDLNPWISTFFSFSMDDVLSYPDARGSDTILTVFRGKSKVAGALHIGISTGYAQAVVVHVELVGSFKGVTFVFFRLVGL